MKVKKKQFAAETGRSELARRLKRSEEECATLISGESEVEGSDRISPSDAFGIVYSWGRLVSLLPVILLCC